MTMRHRAWLVTLAQEAHGPGLKTFVTASIDPDIRARLDRLQVQGVTFGACGNTMKNIRP
jgi:intracellular sulfur oxidation DsrE/DsrF family protein